MLLKKAKPICLIKHHGYRGAFHIETTHVATYQYDTYQAIHYTFAYKGTIDMVTEMNLSLDYHMTIVVASCGYCCVCIWHSFLTRLHLITNSTELVSSACTLYLIRRKLHFFHFQIITVFCLVVYLFC